VKHIAVPEPLIAAPARARLAQLAGLLLRWNQRINLIAAADEADLWTRHILDSAQLASLLPEPPAELIDLGSGGGFPGLVLALTTSWTVHLVESDQRKAAFLREAVRVTGAKAIVHAVRAEKLAIPPAPVVTARALASVSALLELVRPLLTADGVCVLPKGRSVDTELTAAAREWHMRVERFPSCTGPGATLLRISEIRRVGPDPRPTRR
jgi:16S rRNA (guanine(527)-N(7))-methyltransferase RsmG